jgi:hypothetical protein
MIEELQFLLDKLGNIDDLALWVLGGFAVYKLVIYLSGVGAAVMLTKLFINKVHDASTRPKRREVELGGSFIHHSDWQVIKSLLLEYKSTGYWHSSDVKKITKALNEGLDK